MRVKNCMLPAVFDGFFAGKNTVGKCVCTTLVQPHYRLINNINENDLPTLMCALIQNSKTTLRTIFHTLSSRGTRMGIYLLFSLILRLFSIFLCASWFFEQRGAFAVVPSLSNSLFPPSTLATRPSVVHQMSRSHFPLHRALVLRKIEFTLFYVIFIPAVTHPE